MKTQTNQFFSQLSNQQLKDLTAEVKETVATDFQVFSKKISAADVWNIQRQKRARVQRRFAL